MRIFVLCTGRCGSTTFIEACKHIANYTCGHESQSTFVGKERINYPDNHIEADNRLSWMLGRLDEIYGDNAFYVHLIRNREDTARSYAKRFDIPGSIIIAYCEAVLMTQIATLNNDELMEVSRDYYDTVNANIQSFLKDKTNKMTVLLEYLTEDFKGFWELIDARGNLEMALTTASKRHNISKKKIRMSKIGDFFKSLKNKILMKFLDKWIADLVDRFKAKSPKVWMFIAAILTLLNQGVGEEALFSLAWILEVLKVPAETSETIGEWVTWIIALVIGTSTTAFLSSNTRREAKIATSKKVSKEKSA
jgi:hypothetical protein